MVTVQNERLLMGDVVGSRMETVSLGGDVASAKPWHRNKQNRISRTWMTELGIVLHP